MIRQNPIRDLSKFTTNGYDKGRNKIVQALWFACQNLFFYNWWLPKKLRPLLLKLFGAKIGRRVLIRHRVRILWPWKLEIGDNSWVGEDVWILNLEKVIIGDNVCLSQGVLLCTGNHEFNSVKFEYRNAPISVGNGAWIALGSTVFPGVKIGEGATVLAYSRVSKDVKPYEIYNLLKSINN